MKDLETDELLIRKFKRSDAEFIFENFASDNEASKVYGFFMHPDIEETKRIILSGIIEYENGEPVWAIELKREKKLIGFIWFSSSKENKVCELISFGSFVGEYERKNLIDALNEVTKFLLIEEEYEVITANEYKENEVKTKREEIFEFVGMKKEASIKHGRINRQTGKREMLNIYSIGKEDVL